ncbi:MAG: methyltransferase domain-containing protein, partial [Methyloglobulus sp.]|nr:methyltransferase domain-containing protein [Methyloglobulus sp.]
MITIFYQSRHQQTQYAANTILTLALAALPKTKSAVDFGCGVGTWLTVLKEKGVEDIQGFDGSWVEQSLLEIPKQNFRQVNLEDKINLDK